MTRSFLLFSTLPIVLVACSQAQRSDKPLQFYQQPAYIPDSLQSVVIDDHQVRWQVLEKRVYSQVGESVDLWLRRSEPGKKQFGAPAFTGLTPSCFGRPHWIHNQKTGRKESACYLRRFTVMGDEILFQMRLGGDWVTAMSVPVDEVFADSDQDGWNDATEHLFGSRADSADSDGDGLADPKDPNPLVSEKLQIPANPAEDSPDFAPSLVQTALQNSKACQKGKPLFISGPNIFKRSYSGLRCFVLWRPLNALSMARRSKASGDTDDEQVNSQTDKVNVDLAAREGGISQVLVDVDRSNPQKPVVRLRHLLGTEQIFFVHGDGAWVISGKKFVMQK